MNGAACFARQTRHGSDVRRGMPRAAGERPRDRSGVGSRTVRILAFSDLHRDERAGRSLIESAPRRSTSLPGVGD
jgi:hypothetical protein